MPLRFRKSVRLGPGVRFTVGKKSSSVSFGGRGLRYTVSSSGRRTTSVGIPGSGLGYTSTSSSSGRRNPPRSAPKTVTSKPLAPAEAIPKAGLFASSVEKDFRRGLVAIAEGDFPTAIEALGRTTASDTRNSSDDLLLGFALTKIGEHQRAIESLERVVQSDIALPDDLMQKYASRLSLSLNTQISPGVSVEVDLDSLGAALLLAELYQAGGSLDQAIELVEGLGEAGFQQDIVAVSLADLYCEQEAWDEVLRVTDESLNEDDLGLAALIFRARAFHAQKLLDAAAATLRDALRSRKRAEALLVAAKYERALVYLDQGQRARARKGFEEVAALDRDYADVQARIQSLAT